MRTARLIVVAAVAAGILVAVAGPASATAVATISPGWSFGSQFAPGTAPGNNGVAKTFTVTNTSGAPLDMGTTGAYFGTPGTVSTADFTISNDGCKNQPPLAAGATCTVQVTPHPVTTGQHQLTLSIAAGATTTLTDPIDVWGESTDAVYVLPGQGFNQIFWNHIPQELNPDGTTTVIGFHLRRSTDPATVATGTIVTSEDPSNTSYGDGDVTPGIGYYYQVFPFTFTASLPAYPPSPIGAIPWAEGQAGNFYPLSRPTRILDTRNGNGAPKAPLGANSTLHLQVAGRNGVIPRLGLSSVVLNVTEVAPGGTTGLTVFPTGAHRPSGESVWANKGQVVDNNVTVKFGSGGKVDIYNNNAAVNVVVDVIGFYSSTLLAYNIGFGGQYQLYDNTPYRILDSRKITNGILPPHYFYHREVGFNPRVEGHVRAIVLSVIAVGSTGSGDLAVYGTGSLSQESPLGTVHYSKGVISQNIAIAAVDPGTLHPTIAVANLGPASTHVVVDVVGFYDDNTIPFGGRYVPMASPVHLVDSSKNLGISGNLGSNGRIVVAPGANAVHDTLSTNLLVTAVRPTATTSLAVWPDVPAADGGPIPTPGEGRIQAPAGWITTSTAIPVTGVDNKLDFYNAVGSTSVRLNLVGRYDGNWIDANWYDPGFSNASAAVATTRAVPSDRGGVGGSSAGRVHVQLSGLSAQPDATVLH